MKNILGCISLLCMALWIQAQSITEIEYYFNTDPGIGNGKKLPAMAEIESTIDISGLEEGVHTLFIRAKDSKQNWSLLQHRTFNKIGTNPEPVLSKMEYYFDDDPGLGNGKQLSVGEEIETAINIEALDEGVHTLYIRTQDNNAHWSLLQSRTFIKLPYIEPALITDIKVKIDGVSQYADWVSIGDFTPAEEVSAELKVNVTEMCNLIGEELKVEAIAINDNNYASNVFTKNINVGCTDEDDFCPSVFEYKIINHESFPNQLKYEIMETGIVHHFFQLTDMESNPLKEGIEIYYNVDYGNGLPVQERISKPSNKDGIVNLYFDTNWDDESTEQNEVVQAGSNIKISFKRIDFPAEYKNNYCMEFFQNDFDDIEIQVGELKPSSKEYGLFANGGTGISGCLICVPGYSLLETGVKGKVGSSLSLQNKYDALGELSSVIMRLKGKVGLGFNVDIFEVGDKSLKISVDGINSNLDVWAKGYLKLVIDMNVINHLLIYYQLIKYNNFNSVNSLRSDHLLEKALEELLKKVGKQSTISTLESGTSYEYGAKIKLGEINAGELIKFILFDTKKENFKSKFEFVTLDVNAKKESGVKIKYPDKESYFIKQSAQQKWGGIKFGAEDKSENATFSLINSTSLENYRRGFEYSVERNISTNKKNAQINCNNVYDLIYVNSEPYDIEYSFGFDLDENVMDFLQEQYISASPIINTNNPLLKFLIQEDSDPSKNLETAYNEIDELFRQINTNSSINDAFLEVNRSKFITNKNTLINLNIPKIEILPKIGVGVDWNFSANVGVFSSTSLPSLSSGKYSSLTKSYLWPIEYPTTEKLNDLVKNPLIILFNDIAESIKSYIGEIVDEIKNIVTIVVGEIKDGAVWFVNEIREVISGKNGKAFVFEDFSKIAIGYENDGSVFNQDAEVTLEYYYPEGEIKGITENEDTIIVVSDLFYLNALENGEYLSKAPNGEYMISATLGKDDLAFLSINENTKAEIFYRPLDEVYWRSIGQANGDTLKYDGLGNLAVGVYLETDIESPRVEIHQNEDNQFSAFVSDNTGIDWSTVTVSINGEHITYNRVELTNEIVFSIDSLSEIKDYIITVDAYDLLDNYGFANVSAETGTDVQEILVFNHLLKLFPNPAKNKLNVLYQLPETGNVKFEITDILGRQIIENSLGIRQANYPLVEQIDFNSNSIGVHILNIYLDEVKIESRKFVVQ